MSQTHSGIACFYVRLPSKWGSPRSKHSPLLPPLSFFLEQAHPHILCLNGLPFLFLLLYMLRFPPKFCLLRPHLHPLDQPQLHCLQYPIHWLLGHFLALSKWHIQSHNWCQTIILVLLLLHRPHCFQHHNLVCKP